MTALTKVILEGPLGKQFGREWEFAIDSPREALRMVDANSPGVFAWIKQNLQKYSRYRVVCERDDGVLEDLDNDTFLLNRGRLKSVRFVPLVEGASNVLKIVVGIVLIGIALFVPGTSPWVMKLGIGLFAAGVVGALSPRPRADTTGNSEGKASYLFDGPANTTAQGSPVQLIYGRVLAGSHAISAAVTVDQLM